MTEAEKMKRCGGCRDNFYNDNNPMGVKRCWALKTAKLVKRFQIGTWTQPDSPGAFTEVSVFQCYHANGLHYYEKLPPFVKAEDVRRL